MRRDDGSTDDGIEFLAPDGRAFGDSTQADFVDFEGDDAGGFDDDEPPRSRWLTAVAAVVVCGLIAVGVIAAAPWVGETAVTPTSTTAPPPTTAVATPTTADVMEGVPVQPAGWVIDDPPADLRFAGASSQPMPSGEQHPLDIWVERPDDPTAGRWLVVTWLEQDYGASLARDGRRFVVGDRRGVASVDGNGVGVVRATLDDAANGGEIAIRSNGVSAEALIALVGAVDHDDGPASTISYAAEASSATAGLTLVWSSFVPRYGVGALSEPDASVGFFRPDDGSGMQIEHHRADRSLLPFMGLLLSEVPLPADAAADMQAVGRPTRLFSFAPNADERWLFAVWVDGDQAVTVRSFDLDESATLAAMATARLATDDEWAALVERTQRGISFAEAGPSPSAPLSGTFADGTTWSGSFTSTYLYIDQRDRGWYTPLRVPDGTEVRRYAGTDIDVVTATALWPEQARTMRVTAAGAPPVDVPMVQVGDGPIFVAVYAQREISPIEVELVEG